MRAIVDAHYGRDRTTAACLVFSNWPDAAPIEIIKIMGPAAAAYRSGRFYKRELPILLEVLQTAGEQFETVVIDGYVHLPAIIGKGLGTHLHEALAYAPPVVGVAKTPLTVADRFVPVYRGKSHRPLFVSAIGCPVDEAAQCVISMHGPHRLPTLLKQADRCARTSLKVSCVASQSVS